jgi:hypothetical protein
MGVILLHIKLRNILPHGLWIQPKKPTSSALEKAPNTRRAKEPVSQGSIKQLAGFPAQGADGDFYDANTFVVKAHQQIPFLDTAEGLV